MDVLWQGMSLSLNRVALSGSLCPMSPVGTPHPCVNPRKGFPASSGLGFFRAYYKLRGTDIGSNMTLTAAEMAELDKISIPEFLAGLQVGRALLFCCRTASDAIPGRVILGSFLDSWNGGQE